MTNRRQFLQIGIAASTWPLANHAARAAGIPVDHALGAAPAVPIYKAVYDVRFSQSVAFARRAEQRGIVPHAINGDVTPLWYDDLYHRWRLGAVAIAGLTAHGPLFCLERLAWDQRMRVVFRAEHRFDADGRVEHALSGPVSMLEAANRFAACAHWSERIADVVEQCPSGRAEIATSHATTGVESRLPFDTESLYSWVIAPASNI